MNKRIIFYIFLGMGGLIVFISLYSLTYPIAGVNLNISSKEAVLIGKDFLNNLGFNLRGFIPSTIFYRNIDQALYLQSVLGVEKTNEFIQRDNFFWIWKTRWFRELEKEEFIIGIDPITGKVIHYQHKILDEEPGVDLPSEEAKLLAEGFLKKLGFDLETWGSVDYAQEKQKARTDHSFEWEKKDFFIGEAPLRVYVNIKGDKIGGYWRYFKVPERFIREYRKKQSYGIVLSLVSSLFTIFIYILCFANLFLILKKNKFFWQFSLYSAFLVFILSIFDFFNSLPSFWYYYDTTTTRLIYLNINFFSTLISAILFSLMIFLFGAVGHSLNLIDNFERLPLIDSLKRKEVSFSNFKFLSIGYLMGFFCLGFVTLFYYFGIKYFKVWIPMEAEYSNMLGDYLPFLQPLTIGLTASISEEFVFRFFSVSLIKKYLKKDFIAVIIPSLIWAFSHTTYEVFPPYVRGIELTIVGMVLGYLFLRFGLETVITVHYVVNAVLVSIPLLKSKVFYYQISGILVILLLFLPLLLFFSIKRFKKNKDAEF